jgi:hypothetical protein
MNDFKKVCLKISERLTNLPYVDGDISDIGNEIGYVLSYFLVSDSFGWDKDSFISGLNHGIDLNKDREFFLSEIMRLDQENGLYDDSNDLEKDK